MSNVPWTPQNDEADPALDGAAIAASVRRSVVAPLQFVGFWAAVALPFLYLPLLFGGLTGNELPVFVGLLAVNLIGLVLGRSYRTE